nr:ADP-ribosylglycohydrolase family protein [Tessaracoccus coleopterorum]
MPRRPGAGATPTAPPCGSLPSASRTASSPRGLRGRDRRRRRADPQHPHRKRGRRRHRGGGVSGHRGRRHPRRPRPRGGRCRGGRHAGHATPGASVPHRIRWAVSLALGPDPLGAIETLVGTSVATQEAVPAALAIVAAYRDDPWGGVLAAAGLGGDSDTVAAMAGAVLGAVHGVDAFPADEVAQLELVNPDLHLRALAAALLELRR